MSVFVKLAVICILCAALSLSIKKHSPEIALLMAVAALIGCITVSLELFNDIKTHMTSQLHGITLSLEYFAPLLKCCAVSVITQISCSLCKDAGQAAAASGLEFTGNIVSVLCLFPLIEALFDLIGGLL